MARYRDQDEHEPRGAHRRRYQRTSSTTPIIIGACVVVGIVIVGFLLYSLMGKKDPEAERAIALETTEKFMLASLNKDARAVMGMIHPSGPHGWVTQNFRGTDKGKMYLNWNKYPTEIERAEAKKFRDHQNERMLKEILALPVKLGLADSTAVRASVKEATVALKGGAAVISMRGTPLGLVKLWVRQVDGGWKVENWEVVQAAPGT
jgi:hypothetical protein